MISNGKLDDALLEEFMTGFYGYGDWDAKVWFVGMEEGGGKDIAEIDKRLRTWEQLGKNELVDVCVYLSTIGVAKFFDLNKPVLQRTWGNLIRLLLSLQDKLPLNSNSIKGYQASEWGRSSGETCLIELYPLPSPSTRDWKYAEWSSLPCLVNRTVYHYSLFKERADFIRLKIETHKPSKVIFYGSVYNNLWEGVIRGKFAAVESLKLWQAGNAHTDFYIIRHPVAHGLTTAYFEDIGRYIRNSRVH